MSTQLSVSNVERLVLDEQADDLPVRDIDDRLALVRIAVCALCVGQPPDLMKPAEVGPGYPVRLTLVEVSAHPDVSVRKREHGLGLRQRVEVERGLANRPRLNRKCGMLDHCSSSSDRSFTTMSLTDPS